MGTRKNHETGGTESPNSNNCTENPKSLVNLWKRKQLRSLADQIYQLGNELEDKKPGASLVELEQMILVYNKVLVEIFGVEGAKRVPNLKVIGNKVQAVVPRIEQNGQAGGQEQQQKKLQRNKVSNQDR